MKFPASSNSSTGGGAMLFWSLRTVDGRCRIQACPWLSIDTLDTWPHTHLLGSFGHDGSTSKCGIMRGFGGTCAVAAPMWPQSTMAAAKAVTAERVFACIGNPPGLVWVDCCSIFSPIEAICRKAGGATPMQHFKTIRARAAKRKGGEDKLVALLPKLTSKAAFAKIP